MNACRHVQIKISRYTLAFDFLGTDGFKCVEKILFDTEEKDIKLDAKNINVESITLNEKPLSFKIDEGKRFLNIELPETGTHEIQIEYSAPFNSGLTGLYIARKGPTEMITTDFEPDGASFAFPCFDQPDKKAAFLISVRIKDGHEAISNMPVDTITSVEGGKLITFQETPKMSTYLVYIGVGIFTTKTINHGKCHIALTVPGENIGSDDFPLEVASRSLDFYEEYFGIPYQLPKMHLIAVPEFAAGAMENWGAITFRESQLLHNENTDTDTTMMIAVTIAHEIAHQWFGNLVTMEWWNDLWLNESFATFMSSLCINAKYPEFEEVKSYYMGDTVSSMKLDCLSSTHPINVSVKTPDEIKEIFDEISYGKGGSILRMIHRYTGDKSFREGLRNYLTKFKFGNAKGVDLWTSIGEESGLPVAEVMDSWIKQPGFPMITATYDGAKLKLTQERFIIGDTAQKSVWKIPVLMRTDSGEQKFLMNEEHAELEIEHLTGLNSDGAGYYLWLLDGHEVDDASVPSSLDQADLINNAYFSFVSGHRDFQWFSSMCMKSTAIWDTPATTLCIRNALFMESVIGESEKFKMFAANLSRSMVERYASIEKKKPLEIVTESESSKLLVYTDEEYSLSKSKMFKNYFLLSPDDRNVVAISKGLNSENIEDLSQVYKTASDDSDKYNIMEAMTLTRGKKNHKAILSMVKNSEIKQQDVPYAFVGLIRNKDSRKFVISNFGDIVHMVELAFGESGILSRLVSMAIPYLGLENEKKIMKRVDEIDIRKIGMGVKKGKELLEVFKRISEYVDR